MCRPASAGPVDSRALVDWIAAHPDRASVRVDDGHGHGHAFAHVADRPRPIASAVRVAHLVAYAQAVDAGRLDPAGAVPVAEWERRYVAGSDGGVHRQALTALGATPDATVTRDDLAARHDRPQRQRRGRTCSPTPSAATPCGLPRGAVAGTTSTSHIAGEGLWVLRPGPPDTRRAGRRAGPGVRRG